LATVAILTVMMLIATAKKRHGTAPASPPLRLLGWLATAAMAMAVLVMLGSWLD
jgi:hypothetical protein